MNLLPAAFLRHGKRAPETTEPEIGAAAAVALALLAVATVFIVGEAYLTRVVLTVEERTALLTALLLCDAVVFAVALLVTAGLRRRGTLSSNGPVAFGALMVLPIIFIASDLAFKPRFFSDIGSALALALSALGFAALTGYIFVTLESLKPRSTLAGYLRKIRWQHLEGETGPVALQRPVLRGDDGLRMVTALDGLCRAGECEPVLEAIAEMKVTALAPQKNARSTALAASMVALAGEAAAIGAKHSRPGVVYHALDAMKDIAIESSHPGTSALAFRAMGGIFSVCSEGLDERAMSRLGAKMMETYIAVYDGTGRQEALELAAAMAEKATGTRTFGTEEYDGVLYLSGGVYRRLAEAADSEEHANKALTALFEALTARTSDASPIDHAYIKGEIGRAYMALAKLKNPVKGYKNAASAFEDAGRALDAKIYPWDSALYKSSAAAAYTFLADEYCRGRRYDDAIQAARGALALYPEALKFFEKRSPEHYVETASNMGFAHTIVGEVYLKSRMFDLSLKHASHALGAYSSAAKILDVKTYPERYAFLKTCIGQTHANMAEIHFREKRYEGAITSCDGAIAAYNEAIRIYDERKKEKPASAARKHLKKANDLFSTMMRIGVAEKKPLAPLAEL